jgi:cobalt-zinc-cadmium efflux system membrane fusion protein
MKRIIQTTTALVFVLALVIGTTLYWSGHSDGNTPSNKADEHSEHKGETGDHAGHKKSEAPHDEGEGKHEGASVELSDAKMATARIKLEKASPGILHDSIVLNGILQPNQEKLVQVSPRFPGIVREVYRKVGDHVRKDDVLAKIESNQSLTVYDLAAPLEGTIIDRQIALGEHVGEQKNAFTIADLSSIWVDFSVYRRDLPRIRIGDTVIIDAEDGGPAIETKISYISPVGNSDTQSALARAVVTNGEQRLRAGLFVTGRVLLRQKPVGLAVKSTALQTVENRTVVFVREGDRFEARAIETGDRDTAYVEVTSGLQEGDVYASDNSFVIKAELAKGSASHEH